MIELSQAATQPGIPGWLYILLAGVALTALGIASLPLRKGRVPLALLGAGIGVVLAIFAIVAAVTT